MSNERNDDPSSSEEHSEESSSSSSSSKKEKKKPNRKKDDDEEEEGRPGKKSKVEKKTSGAALSLPALEVAPPSSSGMLSTVTTTGIIPTNTTKGGKPIIVLLDQATLETVKNKKGVYELLNCDDHRDVCKRKLKKDPNLFRPDILHQELLALLDSPLNKAGLLQVYIHTTKHVLIEMNPSIRIPRTFKRFSGLMVQLLHKMKIKASTESSTTLLKVIKNPFSQHLPAGTQCIGMSCQGTLYSPQALARKFVPSVPPTSSSSSQTTMIPTCIVAGAMSTGHIQMEDHPYIESMVSISDYPLSGAAALSRLASGIEQHWGVV